MFFLSGGGGGFRMRLSAKLQMVCITLGGGLGMDLGLIDPTGERSRPPLKLDADGAPLQGMEKAPAIIGVPTGIDGAARGLQRDSTRRPNFLFIFIVCRGKCFGM